MKRRPPYNTNKKEVYALELNKLQRCFSEVEKIGEEVSEVSQVGWRHVEHLRQLNFMLQEARIVGEALLKIPIDNS